MQKYNKRYKKSNKKIYLLCLIMLILTYTISICYSTLSRNLEINGLVKVRLNRNIRVTGISIDKSTEYSSSEWEEYDVKNVSGSIILPNAGSTITYKVEVTNFGNVDMGIYSIDGLDERLEYTIEEYNLKDKILKGGTKKEIYITIKYKEGTYDLNNTRFNISLNFDFRGYYNVIYDLFPYETDSLPNEVMERDNLVVDLSNYQGRYDIFEDYIELSNNRYTYINNILTITSVEGEIYILYKDISEIELVLRNNDENNQLTEDLVGDMFRYQGTDNVNNWICFGTTMDCSKTEEDIDKYMYRIIGVTDDGELALIKETVIKEGNKTQFQWNDKYTTKDCEEDGSGCTWENSKLFNRLNGLCETGNANCTGTGAGEKGQTNLFINSEYYDYLTSDSVWESMIDYHTWKYGDTNGNNGNFNGNTIYAIESQFPNSIEAKIGLQYLHDYYYAYKTSESDAGNPESLNSAKNAWIHFHKDDYNTEQYEWLISQYGVNAPNVYSWIVYSNGHVNGQFLNGGSSGVRPVFYLYSYISFKEGTTGEKNNPYIIDTGLPVSLGEFCAGHSNMGTCITNKKNFIEEVGNITSKEVGEMYRYQGTDKYEVNNWICFGTTDIEECTSGSDEYGDGIDKYMYRIIGVTPEGELALIKETVIKEDNGNSHFIWNDKYSIADCGENYEKCTWPNSKLFNRLNGVCETGNENCTGTGPGFAGQTNIFINNEYYNYLTNGSPWESIISNHTWKYGESEELQIYNGDSAYSIENQFPNNIEAKIGLQYVHDYLYAYPGGNPGSYSNAKNTWIHSVGNYLMSLAGLDNYGNQIHGYGINSGGLSLYALNSGHEVRPVFYLKPDVKLSAAFGDQWDPFIITNVNTD